MEVEAGVQAVMWWREMRTTGKAWLPCPQLTPAVLTSLQRQTCIHSDPGVGGVCPRAQSLSPVPPFPAPWRVARIWGRVCAHAHTPSLRPGPLFATHGVLPARLLYPWDFPGRNIGVGCHFHLQGIFPTQGWNPHLRIAGWDHWAGGIFATAVWRQDEKLSLWYRSGAACELFSSRGITPSRT